MKRMLFLMLAFMSMTASAEYIGGKTPSHMFGSEIIMFGINSPPLDTCNYFERHFKFDATTESGKNMLSILLSAIMAEKKVDIWYAASTAPGTNQDNDCIIDAVATVNKIGIR